VCAASLFNSVMDCIFCKIVAGDIPANIIYKNGLVTAFTDLNPQAPTHILIIPNQHIESLDGLVDEASTNAAAACLRAAAEIAQAQKVSGGYRVVTNTGPEAGQSVQHLHFHLLGGRRMTWPPG
jgi:histidine triad (HIT) family protein